MFHGYKLFSSLPDITGERRGYGLLIAVKESPLFGAQLWGHTSSSLWVCLRFLHDAHLPLYLGNVYIPPPGSPLLKLVDLQTRFDELQGMLMSLEGYIFVGGDFNGHVAQTSTSSSVSLGRLRGQDTSGCKLVQLADQSHLVLCTGCVLGDLDTRPTFRATSRTSATRPDHILVSPPLYECLHSLVVSSDLKGSDHFGILTSLSLRGLVPRLLCAPIQGVHLREIRWHGGYRVPLVQQLEQAAPSLADCIALADAGNVEQAILSLSNIILTASHRRSHLHQPFFDSECIRLKRDWRREGRRLGFSDPQVRGLERQYHAYVRSRKRVWLMSQLEECVALFHTCPRQFWRSFR